MRKLLLFSLAIVAIDQATKLAVKGFNLFGINHKGMTPHDSFSVIGDFLRFTFIENPGMAFGLDFGIPFFLGIFSIGAAIFLVYILRKSKDNSPKGFQIALAMILGGAVGNLIDRVFYGVFYGYGSLFRGKVVDFIDFDIPDIDFLGFTLNRFYVFNIADAAVSVGIGLLLFYYLFRSDALQGKSEESLLEEREHLQEGNSDGRNDDVVDHLDAHSDEELSSSQNSSEEADRGKPFEGIDPEAQNSTPSDSTSDSSSVDFSDSGSDSFD